MPILSRDEIRARSKAAIRTEDVPCPELGEDAAIRLRQLTGGELVRYQRLISQYSAEGNEGELALVIVQMCAVDEAMEALWPGDEGMDDIRALGGDVLTRLCERAAALNGVTDETVEEAAGN